MSTDGGRGRARRASIPQLPSHLIAIHVQSARPARPLTREQAARALGRHARTIDRWSRLQVLRTIDLGGTVRIPAEETQRLLAMPRSRRTP